MKFLTTLFLLIPFVVLGQGKDSTGQAWRPTNNGLTAGYGIPIGHHIEIDTSVESFTPFNMIFPKTDTTVRIYKLGPFIIISMAAKNGEFKQVASKDVDGAWIFNKGANVAMDALYFSIMHSK